MVIMMMFSSSSTLAYTTQAESVSVSKAEYTIYRRVICPGLSEQASARGLYENLAWYFPRMSTQLLALARLFY
jgi:hypothetical protein